MSQEEANHAPPMLRLPVELRELIYDHLLELKNANQGSHPLPGVAITSVSHAPPSSNLLLLHPTITTELLDRFYSQASCKTVISHAFNFFRTDPELRHLESSLALKRIQRVELVFFQDILLLKDYPSFGLESFCAEIRRRADRACDVFLQAPQLKSVTISWIDTTRIGGWAEKIHILEPLSKLKGRVNVSIGEVKISGDPETQEEDLLAFKDAVEQALGVPIKMPQHSAHVQEDLRLLAFDIRQQPLHENMIP
jgi:hypothetical protein